MSNTTPLIAVIMGSTSDADIMKGCMEVLQELDLPYEVKVLSAHRTPEQTRQYAISAEERGICVIIAGAGWAAHLAGVIASHTTLPVIGIPIDSSPLKGLDALLSTVQMPPGIPVATVSIGSGGAKNAAILAAEIVAIKYPAVREQLTCYREQLTQGILEKAKAWENE